MACKRLTPRPLQRWSIDGVPDNPTGWIAVVARRWILDRIKHRRHDVSVDLDQFESVDLPVSADIDEAASAIPDERLRLIFMCCHPAIAQPSQVALTLRSLCGLTTREIARALVETEIATAQKLTRAKRKISQAGIGFELPSPESLEEKLAAVLAVIYLVFNEGYLASGGSDLMRPDLCTEAIRLGRLLHGLMPHQVRGGRTIGHDAAA